MYVETFKKMEQKQTRDCYILLTHASIVLCLSRCIPQTSIKIFRDLGLDTNALKALVRLVKEKTFEKDEILIKEGEPTDAALYLVRPPAKLTLTTADGARTEHIDGGGFFGDDQLKLDAKMGKNDHSAPTRLKGRYTVTATEAGTCGVLHLADCRLVFDTLQLGKTRKELSARPQIPFEKLERHTILGAGTFGQVWLVSYKDPNTGNREPFALKIQVRILPSECLAISDFLLRLTITLLV